MAGPLTGLRVIELAGIGSGPFPAMVRADLLEGSDACSAPVLSLDETHRHPHNGERRTFTEVDGVLQPAPRFSRTPAAIEHGPVPPGRDPVDVLTAWRFSDDESDALLACGTVAAATGEASPG